jgi:thioredoxin reductase (NADPH)
MDKYDLIIIGAGPAGLTTSIYASCYHFKHLVIGSQLGGQLQFAPDILNYPGFEDISGKELTERMVNQVKARGGKIVTQSVIKISKINSGPASCVSQTPLQFARENTKEPSIKSSSRAQSEASFGIPSLESPENFFIIETSIGKRYRAKAIILATGMERRKLNVPGEVEYTGRGVHYCATCEKQDYEGSVCAVVGGGNAAVQATVELATAAKKVYLIYRGTELRGDSVWLEKIKQSENIEVLYQTVVQEIMGNRGKVTELKLSSYQAIKLKSNEAIKQSRENINSSIAKSLNSFVAIDKIFIEIGGVPGTALVIPLGVEVDNGGYIRVNPKLETNIPGIFAAGDMVRFGLSIEQISSAVGLGARAANSAFAYLTGGKTPSVWGKAQIKR